MRFLFIILTVTFTSILILHVGPNDMGHVIPSFTGKAYAYYGTGRRIARRTARRTARRVVRRHSYYRAPAAVVYGVPAAATIAIGATVMSLPPSCSTLVVNGLTYYNCGGTYYQAAYDGPNLVYVVVEPPR